MRSIELFAVALITAVILWAAASRPSIAEQLECYCDTCCEALQTSYGLTINHKGAKK